MAAVAQAEVVLPKLLLAQTEFVVFAESELPMFLNFTGKVEDMSELLFVLSIDNNANPD